MDGSAAVLTKRIAQEIGESAESFLGSAEVTSVDGNVIHVALPNGARVVAQLALAFPYKPAHGDVLLVIGKDCAHYVIGVLHGSGKAELTFQGDLELRTVGGTLSLASDTAIDIDAPAISLRAKKLLTLADSVIEKVSSFYQHVSSLSRIHAKEMSTVVDETASTQAKNATLTADDAVLVNGKQILLG